eukprot:762715-Hanusia_phi.AAC.9
MTSVRIVLFVLLVCAACRPSTECADPVQHADFMEAMTQGSRPGEETAMDALPSTSEQEDGLHKRQEGEGGGYVEETHQIDPVHEHVLERSDLDSLREFARWSESQVR